MSLARLTPAVALFGLLGCSFGLGHSLRNYDIGPELQQSQSAAAGRARRAQIDIEFGPGEMKLQPGQAGEDGVLQVQSRCNVRELEPTLTEQVWGRDLRVELRSREGGGGIPLFDWDDICNEWDVQLAEGMPMDLSCQVGAGAALMDLGGLSILSLQLEVGAADFELDFSRPNPERMRLLQIDVGAADCTLRNLGNARCDRIVIDGGMMDLRIDLGGEWPQRGQLEIDAGMCDITLEVPEGLAVLVKTQTTMADVDAPGFLKGSAGYRSSAASERPQADVDVVIELSLGSLSLVETPPREHARP